MRGKQLKVLMDALEVSHADLSGHLGYSRHAIGKWVSRDVEIPREYVPRICAFFKARLNERQQQHRVVLDIIYICSVSR
jgi:hypothetical protein